MDKKVLIKIVIMVGILIVCNLLYSWYDSNNSIISVFYRAKINNKYTNWSKNGKNINNKKSITDIEIKLSNEKDGKILLEKVNKNGKALDDYSENTKKTKGIYGVRIYLTKILNKKYDICYRTYNKKDKWLDWACSGEISGNKKYKIENIKVKIIPKNVLKSEYLDNYKEKIKGKSKGF